ncbi:hypothetical protein HMPREF9248_1116 [Fannyhessea vaginae PB189-T1-4]|jgi:hypothetical protein|uniref:DUF1700 domain-containing protein n=1 Tax=Fannyhessea vaginae PB189-T1-4 TaxID=866774 RepID=A0ABN0B1D7_9ACTN|nr:DUF1700 domain-containing protein [Fannyhessea vaginae]EFL44476.1 hypothetical protein HMPREF9248_1116 [Fannyhessea vaginae PB189-T1-4]
MGNKSNYSALEKYLSQVDKHLKYMPVSEKTDILSELKSSFYERVEQGQTENDIIAEMGPAKDFALSYLGKAIVENKNFSFRHFMMALGFYSFASLAWVSLIPALAICSASFFFSCGVSVLAGAMGLLKGFLHIPLIDKMQFIFFIYELKGIPALLVGLLSAVIFFFLGILSWKGTVGMIRLLQSMKWKLDSNVRNKA